MRNILIALAVLFGASVSFAADTPPDPPTAADPLADARSHVAAKRWPQAIAELTRVNETGNADWNNLMGYALRKQAAPDLAAAERHYDAALRITPKHRGALEYSGELYLIKGDLTQAEQRLAQLSSACIFGCEEYTDLKKAVERFKIAGNKFVSAP